MSIIWATHPFRKGSLNILDTWGREGCATCGRPRSVHRDSLPERRSDVEFIERIRKHVKEDGPLLARLEQP